MRASKLREIKKKELKKMENLPKGIKLKEVKEVLEHLKRWDKKIVFMFGWWFKLVGENIEIFNDDESIFYTITI